ncbi:MAG: DUF1646 family protein [Elusimicrobiaceae bacterium]|jgi:predicted cation transporter|nr:DUF1646 family protein [Elusimicrobiaceae bacterium]MBT3954773.1 DUF1646 family protein [Elusimicrobiaceae bacterium]MBT4008712.1 DUF1646 family protein [Elusimicrobiaceae bacterium]MBT4403339.1 DUF1646 family protein [Elusimicrobiaceae bacterium]MBT4439826.1 DUF1646 family protein [Elusimicrobiaceae bacterium]
MELSVLQSAGLSAIAVLVLTLPFFIKKVEEDLEIFLFIMGVLAATISGMWNWHLIEEGFKEPFFISATVLCVGFVFKRFRDHCKICVLACVKKIGHRKTVFAAILVLGLLSSVITAIIAALILSQISANMHLTRRNELKFIVYGCFAIGLGAALTPIGEPLATIAIAKLKGAPHYADFFFLLRTLWMWIIPGVLFLAFLGSKMPQLHESKTEEHIEKETYKSILQRAGKVYLFIMGLIFLGAGVKPLAEVTVALIPREGLYWINIISAVLDNATLVAAEMVPTMSQDTIVFLLMGLIVSGGLLIQGNIPNIICAGKIKIKSKEWAKTAFPVGIFMLLVYFILLSVFVV